MEADQGETSTVETATSLLEDLYAEISSSPINIALLIAILVLVYKIFKGRTEDDDANAPRPDPPLPKMKKQDMTLEELRKYDGIQGDGRVLCAINGRVFDVTKGKRFYGPGGPYSSFAGHDASRALAMFQTDLVKEEYDDLSDLDNSQMESIREWDAQLAEKYDVVGRLLKPGEEPSNYTDDEEGKDDKSKDD